MSRARRWLPNATPMLAGWTPFEFKAPDWERIEAALGASLDQAARNELAEIAGRYRAVREVELNPPLASDALDQVDAVEEAARTLQAALKALLSDEMGTGHRVWRLFDYALRETRAPKEFGALAWLEPLPDVLLDAAKRVRAKMTAETPLNDMNGDPIFEIEERAFAQAWDMFEHQLAVFARMRHIKPSVRNDYFKTTQYVQFVAEILKALPEKYGGNIQSLEALSKAISRSRQRQNFGTNKPA